MQPSLTWLSESQLKWDTLNPAHHVGSGGGLKKVWQMGKYPKKILLKKPEKGMNWAVFGTNITKQYNVDSCDI
jgi:hypothetical protein